MQTNVPQDNKIHPTPDQQDRDFERMMDLTRRAAAGSPAPHMIVWPETMVPAALNPEAVDHFRMTRSGWGGSERYHHAIQSLARDLAVHLLVGANSHLDWTVATAKDGQRYEVPGRRFNSAFLYGSDGKQAKVRYDKIHRVPFGEYIPWVERLPRVKDLFLRFISPTATITRCNRVNASPYLKCGRVSAYVWPRRSVSRIRLAACADG